VRFKTSQPGSQEQNQIYLRDPSGNVVSIYKTYGGNTDQTEIPLYGSSRLGVHHINRLNITNAPPTVRGITRTTKRYELSNHLGNVLTTISDRRHVVYDGNGQLDYVEAEVISAQDYYPFGLEMLGANQITPSNPYSGRSYINPAFQGDEGFRYGFNGKERDPDFHEDVTNYDYGFRIYNPGIARFLSVDPLTREFPMLTPYQYASNTPIMAKDFDGLEGLIVTTPIPQIDDVGATDVVVYDDISKDKIGYGIAVHTFGKEYVDEMIASKSTDYLVVNKEPVRDKYIYQEVARIPVELNIDIKNESSLLARGDAYVNNLTGREIPEAMGKAGNAFSYASMATTPVFPPLGAALSAAGASLSGLGAITNAAIDVEQGNTDEAISNLLLEVIGLGLSGYTKASLNTADIKDQLTKDVVQSQVDGVITTVKEAVKNNNPKNDKNE